jgi:hypothetical protein
MPKHGFLLKDDLERSFPEYAEGWRKACRRFTLTISGHSFVRFDHVTCDPCTSGSDAVLLDPLHFHVTESPPVFPCHQSPDNTKAKKR